MPYNSVGVFLGRTHKLFAWLFLSTGIFAIVGSIFTWGDGWLFEQTELKKILIPMADLIVAAPLSIIAAVGLWKKTFLGIVFGLVTSGVYLFGSALVYILLFWDGSSNAFLIAVPPIFGVFIAISFIIWVLKNKIK